jgi:HlyD family secretion protein
MKRKPLLIVLILLVIGAGSAFYFLRNKKPQINFQITKVERGDVQLAVTASGKINPVMAVAVGTQVSGIISKLYVDFNSQVKKGQVIAELDRTALMATVQDAKANVDKVRFQVDQAKRDYDRQKQLYEEKVIPLMDFQNAETNYKAAISTLNSMQSQYNRALTNLNYATIIAPINGVVVSRAVDVGQTVAASFNTPTLFTIANDLTKMQVEASVDEADIGNVKVAQKVDFTVDAYPTETFNGVVRQIRLQPTITQNVVTYSVIIDVANKDLKLLPGMTANISIIMEKHSDVLKVPTSALRFYPDPELLKDFMKQVPDSIRTKFKENQKKNKNNKKKGAGLQRTFNPGSKGRVWVKKGEQIVPVRVEIGISDGTFTEVKGNLKEEDEVITNASQVDASSSTAGGGQGQQNPFAPKMPGRGSGGGNRRGN